MTVFVFGGFFSILSKLFYYEKISLLYQYFSLKILFEIVIIIFDIYLHYYYNFKFRLQSN